ncbi:YolD-like family protein [Lysinibacillus sp. JNUCC 51]|uniref:YolD-like family protein n=1 Tax=Lysinibacillus sp. JNUCC-51 TaxID=2792479 RepID=UPI001936650A|nr:YolD-like family protein [Lysinibacillus sp. JNUCC-51]
MKFEREQFYDKKRELIEWELEEIEQMIQRAFKLRQLVTLTLWQNHNLGNKTGFVTGIKRMGSISRRGHTSANTF